MRPILLADDNADDLLLCGRALKKSGVPYPVQTFSSGQQTIEFLAELTPALGDSALPLLCILDQKMPGFHGTEILSWIREHRFLDAVPVIICSSSDAPRDIAEARRLGAQAYVAKYPSPQDFRAIVEAASAFAGPPNAPFTLPFNLLLAPGL